jgi:hypothetical protein
VPQPITAPAAANESISISSRRNGLRDLRFGQESGRISDASATEVKVRTRNPVAACCGTEMTKEDVDPADAGVPLIS